MRLLDYYICQINLSRPCRRKPALAVVFFENMAVSQTEMSPYF